MRFCACVLACVVVVGVEAVQAVVPLKQPLSKVYSQAASLVIVGKVSSVDEARQVVEADVVEVVKGSAAGQKMRVLVKKMDGLAAAVKVGQPMVVFATAAGAASINLAGTWAVAQPIPTSPLTWEAVAENPALRMSFPGSTEALVKIVAELKAGKTTLLETAADPFAGEIKQITKLNVEKPTFLVAADFNGDKKADLLVGTAEGVRLFLQTADGFEDGTEAWGLKGVTARHATAGDVNRDGRADVVLDWRLFTNQGRRFVQGMPALGAPDNSDVIGIGDVRGAGEARVVGWSLVPHEATKSGGKAIAAAFGDFGDDGKMCVVELRENDIIRYSLDSREPTADFARLVGDRLGVYDRAGRGFKGSAAFAMDVNGDGRMDFVVVNESGGMVLINRGFGTFFVSLAGARAISPAAEKKPPFTITSGALCAGADLRGDGQQDLLVLSEDGTLWAVGNR